MFPYLRVGIFKLWKDWPYSNNGSTCRCACVETESDQALIIILIIDFKVYVHDELFQLLQKLAAVLVPFVITRFLCFVQLVSFACFVMLCNNDIHSNSGSFVFPFALLKHKGKKGKVVPVLNLIKHYAMKAYVGVDG
jgi:hypothetical protein